MNPQNDEKLDLLIDTVLHEAVNQAPPPSLQARILQTAHQEKDPAMTTPPTQPPSNRPPLPPGQNRSGMRRPPAPLVSETPVKDVQFAHFGVLNSGKQDKGSLFASLGLNAALVAIAIVIGAATHVQMQKQKEQVTLVVPIKDEPKPKPPEPPKPPPKPLPKPPVIKPVPPKIVLEKVKIPDPP
ncbi:hypothetical protein SAMN05421770_106309, partial [Granulicella rosea]